MLTTLILISETLVQNSTDSSIFPKLSLTISILSMTFSCYPWLSMTFPDYGKKDTFVPDSPWLPQPWKYLFNIIPITGSTYNTINTNNIPLYKVRYNFFQNSFFSFCGYLMEQTGPKYRYSESLNFFKKIFWSSYALLEAMSSSVIIQKESNYLLD